MIKIGKKNFITISFLVVIMLCGSVSAATTYFSTDGKTLISNPDLVSSTLKTTATASTTGIYGRGQYLILKVTGIDNQGRSNNNTIIMYNNDIKSMCQIYAKGSQFVKITSSIGLNKEIIKIYAKGVNNTTYSGSGISDVYRFNGHQLFNNCLETINVYQNGHLYAKCNITIIMAHKLYNGDLYNIKQTTTTKTTYLNGNTRTSVINTIYIRNLNGILTGKKISGTSCGTEKINNKTVNYTGKIYIGTRYDPKDWINEKYNQGEYKEIRTSSSPVLQKIVPFEA